MSKNANPRPITAQTKAMGTPDLRRSKARIVMVARKAHDFMVKTLTGKGYLPLGESGPRRADRRYCAKRTVTEKVSANSGR